MALAYADVELVLGTWFRSTFTTARVVTDLPANLLNVLPVIQVTRIGGGDAELTLDRATVDIDVYASTRSAAQALCEQVRTALRTNVGIVKSGYLISQAATITGPHWRPYGDPAVSRFGCFLEVVVSSHG